MPTELLVLILIVALALAFDFINGFHDTANAVATSIATRALAPLQAVLLAAAFNVLGALSGTAVAKTVGKGIIPPELATRTLVIAALLSAIVWNLITWRYGIPSSSSHALIFSIVGAGIAESGIHAIKWGDGVAKALQGLVFSPFFGFLGAMLLLTLLLWLVANRRPSWVNRFFLRAQVVSAAYMAFSHGSNDAQKTMGIITLALATYYGWSGEQFQVPLWVILSAALAMGIGTAAGGWRIIKTIGFQAVALRPIDGFAAEVAGATVIETASRLGIPLSTTHTISSAILGAGATQRLSSVRWTIAGRIVTAWIVTIPACIALSWLIYTLLHLLTGSR
ncbi:MAG: inorganic phosphate transporter [Deinococcota bacterium]